MLCLPPSKVIYGHADVDSFYSACAMVQNRFLVGKPVGILSNQGYFVVAKSLELKRCGVTTGEPLKDAVQKCPEAIFVKRDFSLYNALSDRFHALMRYLSHTTETYSVDECFFQMPDGEQPDQFALEVRDTVKKHIGLPVTVGLARSKTLAKLISDTAKPFGAKAVLNTEAEHDMLARLPITEVSGIAGRRAKRLAVFGIHTCLDFIRSDPRFIRQVLTVEGVKLWHELRGDPVLPIQTNRKRYQILTRGGSVGQPTPRRDCAWGFAVRNLERLIEELHFHKMKTGKVEFALQFYRSDYTSAYRARAVKLEAATDRFDILVAAFKNCFDQCWMPGLRAARMHLLAHHLENAATAQRGLFDPPMEPELTLAQTRHAINSKIGRFAVRSGATLPLKDVYDDPCSMSSLSPVSAPFIRSRVMCTAVALSMHDLPVRYHKHQAVQSRLFRRGGDEEIRFFYNRRPFPALLPVILDQEFRIVRWGNAQRRSKSLPACGWVSEDDLNKGLWQHLPCQEVVIVGSAALDRGIWFPMLQGIAGIFVEDEQHTPTVYMRMVKPTDYYATMTKAKTMPKLIGEII